MSDKVQYTNSKVQAEDYTSGWKVALILTGLGVSLPMLYLGSEMALTMGLKNAIIAFVVSTVILTILCLITTLIGTRSRLSTYMILRFPFGRQGAKLINFLMGISLLGWFAVALELLSDTIGKTFSMILGVQLPLSLVIVVASVFITITTIYGIRTLEKLANIAVPILLIFLVYVVYMAIGDDTFVTTSLPPPTMTLDQGISALIGSSILVPVLMADFSRYIYNDRQSMLSVLGITIGTPVVWIIAAILADKTGEVDIILIMNRYELIVPAFVLIFVSTWVTNGTNLYSVSLTLSTFGDRKSSYTRLTVIAGVLGTALALFGFSEHFIDFLNVLAIFSPSIAAIYMLDFFLINKQNYDLDNVKEWGFLAIISWVLASLFALLTYYDFFTLSGAYYVDAFLIGGFLYGLLNVYFSPRS